MAQSLLGIPVSYEPKRQNRFYVAFPSELGIDLWTVRKVKRPEFTINSVPIKYINTEQSVAGQYKWEPMDITFLDPIGPSASEKLMEWVRLHAESLTGRMGYAAGYKKDLLLYQLDPLSLECEKWTLEQCMIQKISFGDNDHESDNLTLITLTILPFRCILNY